LNLYFEKASFNLILCPIVNVFLIAVMPFQNKTKKRIPTKAASRKGGVRRPSLSSKIKKAQNANELRGQSGGRRISDRLKLLLAKVVSIVSADSINEAFFDLTDDIRKFFECEMLVIYSVNSDKTHLVSRTFISDEIVEKRIDISMSNLEGYVFRTGDALNIRDVYNKKELAQYPGLAHDPYWDKKTGIKVRSVLVIPVFHKTKTIGVLEIINKLDKAPFSGQFMNLAKNFSKSLGSVLEKLAHEEDKEKLQAIGLAVQQATVMEDILFDTVQPILDLFGSDVVNIFAVDNGQNEIYTKTKTPFGIKERRVPIGPQSIVGWVALEKRMVNIDDISCSESITKYHPDLVYDNTWDMEMGIETKAMLCCPMIHEDKLVGVLQVINTRMAWRFGSNHVRNIITVAQMLAIAFHNNSKFIQAKPHMFSYLINHGILTPEELEFSLIEARKTNADLEDLLLNKRGIKRSDIGKSLESYYGVPYFGFSDSALPLNSNFDGLNKKHLIKNHWVPIHCDAGLIVVLLDDPSDMDKVRNIKMTFPKKEIQFKVGLRADIADYLAARPSVLDDKKDRHVQNMKNVPALLESLISETQDTGLESLICETGDNVIEIAEEEDVISGRDSTIVRLVNKIIIDAHEQGISDIHIEPGMGKEEMLVRYRKEGECEIAQKIPNKYKRAFVSRIKIMSMLDISERRVPQDGKIMMKYGSKEIELRVAICPTVGGNEDVVMRILAASRPLPLEALKFSERDEKLMKASLIKPYGLILVVGPTGSGKTTTLHSALGHINTPKKKIWTAEDPVEITQRGLRQVQMHSRIGLDFASALRSFLRGDPDVIMVGEMRDVETCSIGLEASLTGHLVFSTLHTNSAPETITRLIDMGMNPINFADALVLIVAQRLVKTLCVYCKEDYHPSEEEFDILMKEYGSTQFLKLGVEYSEDFKLKKPVGCERCSQSGYLGRMGLYEMLGGTKKIKRLIMQSALVEEILEQAIQDGMTTLKQDGIKKILAGECDYKQVSAVCVV
jgi:type II secretory ATPase GspE/PulE/Tfp pilus assembly ATPase PilB-like protein/GAF domain-containing protein